jgi:O-methyltransferase
MGFKESVKQAVNAAGYELRRSGRPDLDPATLATIEGVGRFTMTSPERLAAVCDAVRYVDRYGIPGAIVECGVWAGGSTMAAARTLIQVGDTSRDLYLFDTFEGMSEPSDADRDAFGVTASDQLANADPKTGAVWCYASLEDVQQNLSLTGYPATHCHFVKGMVEKTIPSQAPAQIALLRLDTDWYESTRHELEHLIGRVAPNGVLLIDDYGHWKGARQAVDEWLAVFDRPVLLARTDYTGRMAIIPGPFLTPM